MTRSGRPSRRVFDFAEIVVGWTTRDGVATVAPILPQPVAIADVAAVLVDAAAGPPRADAAWPAPSRSTSSTWPAAP